MPHIGPAVIRIATPSDAAALERLAELDSAHVPSGATMIAELEGRPLAALSVADGHLIADPFVSTSDVIELLQVRARQLKPRLAPPVPFATRRPKRRPRVRSLRLLFR